MNAGDRPGGPDERLRGLYAATRELMTAPDREELGEVAVRTAEEIVGLPLAGVYLPDDDGVLSPVAASRRAREHFEELPTYRPGGRVYAAYEAGRTVHVRPSGAVGDIGIGLVVPIDGHGVFVAGSTDARELDDGRVELVELLCENVAVALDRLERERRLAHLHETARELMTARDVPAVAAAATNTAHEVLGLRVNAVYLLASEGDRLVPVSVTEEARELFGGVPELGAESLAWRVFQTGEPAVHGDVREAEVVHNPDTAVRSELVVALGEHGVFMASTDEADAFEEGDVALARVFADNVEAALDRAEREELLRVREAELERQNERLEEFASVVSHDLRNPLNVAQGRLELAMDDCESPHLERIEIAHGRMESLVEDLLALARHGRAVGDTEPVALGPLVREVWRTVDGGDLETEGDLGAVDADESRLRELFENLFRNAAEHAGPDVTVAVGRLPDGGFYVADDGPGIPSGKHEEVFERGYTTAEDGTGFGLSIVREIAEAHGWSIDVAASEAGGARFEVHTDEE